MQPILIFTQNTIHQFTNLYLDSVENISLYFQSDHKAFFLVFCIRLPFKTLTGSNFIRGV